MTRILIVEDDEATARGLELQLMAEGFSVHRTDVGYEALSLAKIYDYDAITLDLNLPDMNGRDVLSDLRAAKVETPVLVLSGTSNTDARVECLNLGADDFMSKPWAKDELIARLRSLVRRSQGRASPIITVGNLVIRPLLKTAEMGGVRVYLTGKEYQLVELLAERAGRVVSRGAILSHLYGGMDEPEMKIVDVFLCKVRKKLARANGGAHYIETAWGQGYVMRDDAPTPPANQSLIGHRKFVLERILAEGHPLTRLEILENCHLQIDRVELAIQNCVNKEHLANIGTPRVALYEVTEAGKAWLSREAVAA